jgi:hypothetical protein
MSTSKEKDLQAAGEILSEMGFDRGAKQSTKAAFIKYLFKQAYGVDVEPPAIYQTPSQTSEPQQLSFNFETSNDKPKAG